MTENQQLPPPKPSGLSAFWAELKRRKVMRVAITYAVVAWLITQIASTNFGDFGIPVWALSLVVMCVILGIGIYMDYDDNRFNDRIGMIYKRTFQFYFSHA